MNTRHKNLKFTFDFEQNNSLSVLDVQITRGSKGFSTSVFRKTTFSGVFTNFDSFIFESYKTFLYYCFAVSQFAQICKVFNCDRFLNVIVTLLL